MGCEYKKGASNSRVEEKIVRKQIITKPSQSTSQKRLTPNENRVMQRLLEETTIAVVSTQLVSIKDGLVFDEIIIIIRAPDCRR
jgi:RecA/RadA recombinase